MWIWTNEPPAPHQTALFRKTFRVGKSGEYVFRISAESNYTAFCDGKEFLRGQYPDYPEKKSYTQCRIRLEKGEHVLALSVYYIGAHFQTCYPSGTPGVWCEMENLFESDGNWLAAPDPAWRRDRLDTVDPQIGFVICYDGAQAVDFTARNFDDSAWQNAVVMKKNPSLAPRPVPVMEQRVVAVKEIERGLLRRDGDTRRDGQPFALTMMQDALRVENGNGFFAIYDLGCERTGRIVLACDCNLPGVVIDIAHGEHLADRRVRSRIGERNFADRYLTKKGKQRFDLPRRIGGRYVQLNVMAQEKDFPELSLSFVEESFPLPDAARFVTQDETIGKMRDNCERTLRCCMHEHYEDCPWREQALYGYDTRNQMLFGYYLWGNYDYATTNWKLFADGLRSDGLLPLNAPSKTGPPIPVFSIAYATAAAEHYLFSGSKSMYKTCRQAVDSVIRACTRNRDEKSGLFKTPCGKDLWHFYEWRDGLDGGNGNGLDFSQLGGEARLESVYNLYVIEMLEAYAFLTGESIWSDIAKDQLRAVRKTFYDVKNRVLLTRRSGGPLHATTQTLALFCGAIPEEDETQLLDRILDGEFVPVSLSPLRYLIDVLMKQKAPRYALCAEKLIREKFLPMTRGDSTTMWETEAGEAAFDGAGSLCHGWSALPLYFFHRYRLGIKPLKPGFSEFSVDVARFDVYGDVSGEVVTPHGKISVRYDRAGKRLSVAYPEGTSPVISRRTAENFAEIRIGKRDANA